MSGKIRAKDLSYDSTLPPFLQKLHAQNTGNGARARLERAAARPKGSSRILEDDGPTMVDEHGDPISKSDFEKMAKASDKDDTQPSTAGDGPADTGSKTSSQPDDNAIRKPGQTSQTIGSSSTDGIVQKKRKVAKVIGLDNDDEQADQPVKAKTVKKAKKASKPKLAFEDEG